MGPCEGATITVDGEATEFVTDANGKATVTIATVGTHVVSATKTKTSSDGTKEISAITAPYCNVLVRAAVTGIALDKTEIALGEDESATITATLTPEGAAGTQITWSTSDDKIATVKDGVVTAVKEGTATITAKAGDMEATCEVTVQGLPKLSALTLRNGILATRAEFALTPAFDPDVREYTITVPDTALRSIDTPNGRVDFTELVGVTDAELGALRHKKLDVRTLYEKLGSDVTSYRRESVIL